jgi:hypothetical protein
MKETNNNKLYHQISKDKLHQNNSITDYLNTKTNTESKSGEKSLFINNK